MYMGFGFDRRAKGHSLAEIEDGELFVNAAFVICRRLHKLPDCERIAVWEPFKGLNSRFRVYHPDARVHYTTPRLSPGRAPGDWRAVQRPERKRRQ